MSAQHTPMRLRYDYEPGYCGELLAQNGTSICSFNDEPSEANARRLVACWNACDLFPTETLEQYTTLAGIVRQRNAVIAERDELLAALKRIEGASMSMYATRSDMLEDCQDIARAAIQKAEGK